MKSCPFPRCGIEVRDWDIKEIHESRIQKTRRFTGKNCLVLSVLVVGIFALFYWAYYKPKYGKLA